MSQWWWEVQPDLTALHAVLENQFRLRNPCSQVGRIDREEISVPDACFGIVYLYTLYDSMEQQVDSIVAKLVYPWRPRWKTEGEVTSMRMLRARRTCVPEVYCYCAEPNPVGLEWILMQHMPGERADLRFADFDPKRRQHVIEQVADLVACLFSIEHRMIGSISQFSDNTSDEIVLGPLNDLAFEDPLFKGGAIPADQCGPFMTKRDLLEAFAFLEARAENSSSFTISSIFMREISTPSTFRMGT
ncbi:hypothetical protein DACRYDRAFT_113574 [Dacryopinax primogenitus]|uniref:Aminoglycoside phosphotransferase domain-containing protein n=1 Tax=Dacryopinax primogenitus (strain DJM 731) TaxID=1858805 RepID=M5GEJ3_DACPD|nr:uncharacterized protein DACRYDRAFT_113574 [Dacryopinax primogenitus]EJU05467.1 hypothetical protein DACRYDRAFT_113574 [Dacryopinax primogenitus]